MNTVAGLALVNGVVPRSAEVPEAADPLGNLGRILAQSRLVTHGEPVVLVSSTSGPGSGPNQLGVYHAGEQTVRDALEAPALEPVVLQIPFHDLANEATGSSLSKNILLLGVLGELFDLPTDGIAEAVERKALAA